jgi:dTDP-4-dehydrorhamnose reductase
LAQVREVLKKKVLVLGSTGLIGHQVFNYLQANGGYELHNISHRSKLKENTINIDARNEEHFLKCIVDIDPDFIINCIGILISDSNSNPENAIFLNAYLPHRLARIANDIDAQLIHISTDCVFSGNKGTPYIETDIKDGLGVYAETKMLGEIINKTHLTLRTSVVGPELKDGGEELFHWFMSQSGVISGYTKSIWSGVTTIELAKAVEFSIRNGMTGLYHVTNNASISKFDLIKLFQKHMRKDIDISPVDGRDTNKSFIDTRNILNYEIPSYDLMISEMAELVRNNKSLYSQY